MNFTTIAPPGLSNDSGPTVSVLPGKLGGVQPMELTMKKGLDQLDCTAFIFLALFGLVLILAIIEGIR